MEWKGFWLWKKATRMAWSSFCCKINQSYPLFFYFQTVSDSLLDQEVKFPISVGALCVVEDYFHPKEDQTNALRHTTSESILHSLPKPSLFSFHVSLHEHTRRHRKRHLGLLNHSKTTSVDSTFTIVVCMWEMQVTSGKAGFRCHA